MPSETFSRNVCSDSEYSWEVMDSWPRHPPPWRFRKVEQTVGMLKRNGKVIGSAGFPNTALFRSYNVSLTMAFWLVLPTAEVTAPEPAAAVVMNMYPAASLMASEICRVVRDVRPVWRVERNPFNCLASDPLVVRAVVEDLQLECPTCRFELVGHNCCCSHLLFPSPRGKRESKRLKPPSDRGTTNFKSNCVCNAGLVVNPLSQLTDPTWR